MGRERKPLVRPGFNRSYHKLVVIATEGEKTEEYYFNELINESKLNSTFYLVPLPSKLGKSSPTSVINRLDEFKREFTLDPTDIFWMVLDRDKQSWTQKEISEIARKCSQKKYGFALSNPCFELWLVLHYKDLSQYPKIKLDLLLNNKRSKASKTGRPMIERELLTLCGNYNKSHPDFSRFMPLIETAIANADKLVRNPKERWPNKIGTHVHKLIKIILSNSY